MEDLWRNYTSGALNEAAQKYLVTDEVLKKYNLKELKLSTSISEEEYKRCKALLTETKGEHRKCYTHRYMYRHVHLHEYTRQRCRQAGRETDRQTDRRSRPETARQPEIAKQPNSQRQADRDRQTETGRNRERGEREGGREGGRELSLHKLASLA